MGNSHPTSKIGIRDLLLLYRLPNTSISSMKILITGNRGFVGAETQKFLEANGHEVIGYDLMDHKDIRDGTQFEQTVVTLMPDRILHLAAVARFTEADKDPKLCYETNVLGTRNVAVVAGKYHIPLAYASTGSVYMPIKQEPPITEEFGVCGNSVYACSKYIGEEFVRSLAHPWMCLRYAHLYGREKRMHGLIGGYLTRLQRGLAPILYGGNQSNDFCYIKDIAVANYLAVTASWDKWNQNYNIGTGEELSAEVAGDKFIKAWNNAYPKEAYKGKVEKKEGRTVDPARFVYDVSKATRLLNFTAEYKFEEGLKDMLNEPSKSEKG